ncbi:MAG: hypothetical protein PHF50_01685 [Patescibacteria group bacterium]|nr:hypothetical protein [Patescibacteria group bacterium]
MKNAKIVEKNLSQLLKEYKLSKKLSLEIIKDWIFNDEGESAMDASNRFRKKWYKYFARVKDMDEMNNVLQHFTDAWNYFPHQSLGGKSPCEIMEEEIKKRPKQLQQQNGDMPKVRVGGHEMEWEEYQKMLKEMELLQRPFRNWAEKHLLPKYKKYLRQDYKKETAEKHFEVADIFFERVLHVGFIEFNQIRKEFIQKEFPHWWQTHVLMSNLNEQEVLNSLKILFQYIFSVYEQDIKKFGF